MVEKILYVTGQVNIKEFAYKVVTPRYDLMADEEIKRVEMENLIPTKGYKELNLTPLQPGTGILGYTWRGLILPSGIFIGYDNEGRLAEPIFISSGGYDISNDEPEYNIYWVGQYYNFLWISRTGNSYAVFAYGLKINNLNKTHYFYGKVTGPGLYTLYEAGTIFDSIKIMKVKTEKEEKELEIGDVISLMKEIPKITVWEFEEKIFEKI